MAGGLGQLLVEDFHNPNVHHDAGVGWRRGSRRLISISSSYCGVVVFPLTHSRFYEMKRQTGVNERARHAVPLY